MADVLSPVPEGTYNYGDIDTLQEKKVTPAEDIDLNSLPNDPKQLSQYPVQTLAALFDSGLKGTETVKQAVIYKKYKEQGLKTLVEKDVQYAHEAGLLTKDEVNSWRDLQQQTFTETALDAGGGILEGALDALNSLHKLSLNFNPFAPAAESLGLTEDPNLEAVEIRDPDDHTLLGDITHIVAQFGIPYAGAYKAIKGAQWGYKAAKLAGLGEKGAQALNVIAADILGGGITSAIVQDKERDETLFNLLADAEWTPQGLRAFAETLAIDPDDPDWMAAFKFASEDIPLGLAAEGILQTARLVRHGIRLRAKGSLFKEAELIEEITERIPATDKTAESVQEVLSATPKVAAEPKKVTRTVTEAPGTVETARKAYVPLKDVHPEEQAALEMLANSVRGDVQFVNPDEAHQYLRSLIKYDDTQIMEMISDIYSKQIDQARGGVVHHDIDVAKVGAVLNADYYTKRGYGPKTARKLAEAVQSADVQVAGLTFYTQNLAQAIQTTARKNLTDIEKAELALMVRQLRETLIGLHGVAAGLGRGVRAFRHKKTDFHSVLRSLDESLEPESFHRLLDEAGLDVEEIDVVVRRLRNTKTPREVMTLADDMGRFKKGLRFLLELKQANLLWGLTTHKINMLGNVIMNTFRTLPQAGGVATEALLTLDAKRLGEIKAMYAGQWRGLKDAFRLPKELITNPVNYIYSGKVKALLDDETFGKFWKALITGESQFGAATKVEGQQHSVVRQWLDFQAPSGLKIPIGTLLTGNFNALGAEDAIFKGVGFYSRAYSHIWREGYKRFQAGMFKTEKELAEWIARESKDMSPDLVRTTIDKAGALRQADPALSSKEAWELASGGKDQAWKYDIFDESMRFSKEVTATDDFKKGKVMQALDKAFGAESWGLLFKWWQLPFFRVMYNLTKFSAHSTPLGLASKRLRDKLFGAGSTVADRAEVLYQMAMGSALVWTGYELAASGDVVGKVPKNEYFGQRDLKGRHAYTFKNPTAPEGQTEWVDLGRFDPAVGLLIGLGADMFVANELRLMDGKNWEDVMGYAMLAFIENFNNAPMMTAMEDITRTLQGQQNWDVYFRRQVSTNVPFHTIGTHYVAENDHYYQLVKEVDEGMWSYFQDAWDYTWKQEEMFPKRHFLYGTPLPKEERWMGAMRKIEPDDVLSKELVRIGYNGSPLGDVITYHHGSRSLQYELTPEEYDDLYQIYADLNPYQALLNVVQSEQFQRQPDLQKKRQLVTNMRTKLANEARERWIHKNIRAATTETRAIRELRKQLEVQRRKQNTTGEYDSRDKWWSEIMRKY